jgi:hypothetical protein
MQSLRRRVLLAVVLVAVSCSSGGEPLPDTTSAADRASGDRTVREQQAGSGFCAGTSLAGTCVQSFLQPVADCWVRPATGGCSSARTAKTTTSCWSNGATLVVTTATLAQHGVWKNATGTVCLEGDTVDTRHTLSSQGKTLTIDDASNKATCPDSSTVPIPTGAEACADLSALIAPRCTSGTCL